MADLLDNTVWKWRLAPSFETIVYALVQQIFHGIREYFLASTELKFYQYSSSKFLLQVVQCFSMLLYLVSAELFYLLHDGMLIHNNITGFLLYFSTIWKVGKEWSGNFGVGEMVSVFGLPRHIYFRLFFFFSFFPNCCFYFLSVQLLSSNVVSWSNLVLTRYCPLWALIMLARFCFWGTHTPKNMSYQLSYESPLINPASLLYFADVGCCANFNVLASARIYCSVDQWWRVSIPRGGGF